ncbi:DUF882 domain-containing protein [Devosia sp.]|uniref:DUF882 domain-containing protein n=1 Tax=Devosia sp. TaxID=1871048 RepID=UPI0035AEF23C
MSGKVLGFIGKLSRLLLVAVLAVTSLVPPAVTPAVAAQGDRTLYLHHTHTGETARFTYKRNGQFDQAVLRQMNVFLADWRTKEPTKMDPALFDLLWMVYQDVGATQPYNIVSSYRSPKTNKMLRAKSSGVAENSQHMRGKAMDVFIPGINLSVLRATAMKYQVGGVGYYPTSGSPFVHMDTGNVRAWPRMTRAQLKKVFPDGKTLHLPTDGKPLSQDGRAYAQAQWTKCHAVPCNGKVTFDTNPGIMVADTTGDVAPIPAVRPRNLSGDGAVLVASLDEPAQRVVPTFEVTAPIPLYRPHDQSLQVAAIAPATDGDDYSAWQAAGAPVPATKSARIKLATRSPMLTDGQVTAVAALTAIEDELPKPRILMTPQVDALVSAYVPTNPDPGAELALKMIIEREGGTGALQPDERPDSIETASLGDGGFAGRGSIFETTFDLLGDTAAPAPMTAALAELALRRQPDPSIALRAEIDFVAPEIDHVNETLVQPVFMTTAFWAELTEAEGYLEKTTELGPLSGRVDFIPGTAAIPAYDRFVTGAPQLVAGT